MTNTNERIYKTDIPGIKSHELLEIGGYLKTDCLYCLKEFEFNNGDIDDNGWVYCPICGGAHETKGFI